MCGIFGIFSSAPIPDVATETLKFINLNKGRGAAGLGLTVIRQGGVPTTYKTVGDPPTTPGELPFVADDPVTVVLGHLLAPTNGDSVTLDRLHPIEDPAHRFLLAHNGMLIDYEGEWDTQWLAKYISQQGLGGLNDVHGQHACWLYDTSFGRLFMWRCMSPLYYGRNLDRDMFWITSVKPLPSEQFFLRLRSGVVFSAQVNPLKKIQTEGGGEGYLTDVQRFGCTSPYTED